MPAATISRAVYVSRLRRAFLMRVHPDRFTQQSPQLRANQATLVKALADRLNEPDFVAWQQQRGGSDPRYNVGNRSYDNEHSYVLACRDGNLHKAKISLYKPVDQVLAEMQSALKKTGAASLPKPPKGDNKSSNYTTHVQYTQQTNDQSSSRPDYAGNINHKYRSQASIQGRDLYKFLQALDPDEIRRRQIARTDAQAAAAAVRRLYKFASVDATSLGWSSSSVAVLLRSLLALHNEHSSSKFRIKSFYPLRLLFTPDDFTEALDIYGGVVRLNPGSTPIQWLEILRKVTPETLAAVKDIRETTTLYKNRAERQLGGVQIRKGSSCSSREFYAFLQTLVADSSDNSSILLLGSQQQSSTNSLATFDTDNDAHSLTVQPLTITVESASACRRPKLTTQGHLRVGAQMPEYVIRRAVEQYTAAAHERVLQAHAEDQTSQQLIKQAQNVFGVTKVNRNVGIIGHEEFVECLSRLLAWKNQHENNELAQNASLLVGNVIEIASRGHFCHLGDDGSIVIPSDWQ